MRFGLLQTSIPTAILALALALALPTSSRAEEATPRPLTLAEAVDLALRVDPLLAQARIAQDRTRLGVLRAQLDRVSVRVDGSIQELWNKSNIAGPSPAPRDVSICTAATDVNGNAAGGPFIFGDLGNNFCRWAGGTGSTIQVTPTGDTSPSFGQGLSNLQLNVNAPVFTGFRITSNVRRAERQAELSDVTVRTSRKDIALAVARVYWNVRRLGLMQEVQQRAVERLREGEQVVQARVTAGLAPPIDQNRARVRILQGLSQIADLLGQQREAAAQVGVSLGLPATQTVVLTDAPQVPEQAPPPVAELLDEARRGRPEIQATRLQLDVQEQVVRMAKSAYYPQVSLFGLFQYGNNAFNPAIGARSASSAANPFANLSGNITLGASLNMNFFDTLNTWTSVRDAQFERARLAEEQRRIARIVENDVRVAHARLHRLYDRRVPLLQQLSVARDNLAILQARYQNGEALVIEFLDSQVELVNTELQVADLTAQLQLAWIELDAALGHVVGIDASGQPAGGGS